MITTRSDITTWHGLRAHPGAPGWAGCPCHHPERIAGFTIVELLVVMSIIILLVVLGGASINRLLHSGRVESGVNTLSSAVASTRAQANRGLGGQGAFFGNTTYKGVALLVTPSDMRIVQHTFMAENPNGSQFLNDSVRDNLYTDIPNLDEIPLPRGSGMVGIARSNNSGLDGLVLFTPPFAIRFNPDGQLIARFQVPIYYDGNYDGEYVGTSSHQNNPRNSPHYNTPGSNAYNPAIGIPGHDRYDRSVSYSTEHSRHIVPLERIDTVIGVIVFSMDELLDDGHTLEASGSGRNPINQPARDWLLEQVEDGTARLILFNRYTGTMIKDPR